MQWKTVVRFTFALHLDGVFEKESIVKALEVGYRHLDCARKCMHSFVLKRMYLISKHNFSQIKMNTLWERP